MKIKNVLKRVVVFTMTLCLSITTIGVVPTFSDDIEQYEVYEYEITKVNLTADNGDLSEAEKIKYRAALESAFVSMVTTIKKDIPISSNIVTNLFSFLGREMFLSQIDVGIRKDGDEVTRKSSNIGSLSPLGMPDKFNYTYESNEEVVCYCVCMKAKDGSFEKVLNITLDTEIVKYISNKYSLVYDPGEGSGTIDPITVVKDQMYTFPQCTFERPDKKIFYYWEMSGVDGVFQPGDTVTIAENCQLDGKITVTAHWIDAPQADIKTDATAKDLKYNNKAQELVTAGTAENGVMQYVLGTNSDTAPKIGWSKTIPQKTEAGTYYVWYRAYGDDTHSNSDAKCCTAVIKGLNDNTLSIKGKTIKVKYKKLKKKTQKIKTKKYIKYKSKGQGKLTYKLAKVKKAKFKKYFKINKKTGKLTIKKKLKKGNYKVIVKVKAVGNGDYNPSAWKKITIKVKVK